MDNSNSQSFASGYFSYSQIIKITRILRVCELILSPASEGSLAGARDRSARDRDNTLYANQTLKTYGATRL